MLPGIIPTSVKSWREVVTDIYQFCPAKVPSCEITIEHKQELTSFPEIDLPLFNFKVYFVLLPQSNRMGICGVQ